MSNAATLCFVRTEYGRIADVTKLRPLAKGDGDEVHDAAVPCTSFSSLGQRCLLHPDPLEDGNDGVGETTA